MAKTVTSRDVNFACLKCGKCCNGPPGISIREAVTLMDDFPLQASVLSMQEGVKLPKGLRYTVAKLTLERQKELGGTITTAETTDGRSLTFVSTLSAVILQPEIDRCVALGPNGKCGIYGRRPNVCRYVPAQHLLPPDSQDLALKVFRATHASDCDWTGSAPPLLRDGKLVQPSMKKAFRKAEMDDAMDAMTMQWLLEQGTTFATEDGEGLKFEDILEGALMSHQKEIRPPFVLLAAMLEDLANEGYDMSWYDLPPLKEIAERQLIACFRMLETIHAGRLPADQDYLGDLKDCAEICAFFASGQG